MKTAADDGSRAVAHDDGRRPVHGYVRTSKCRPSYVEHWRGEMAEFCAQEALLLDTVFVDQGYGSDSVDRPAFSALLRALHQPTCHGVVVAGLHQLSWDIDVTAELCRQIFEADRRLFLVDLRAELVAHSMLERAASRALACANH